VTLALRRLCDHESPIATRCRPQSTGIEVMMRGSSGDRGEVGVLVLMLSTVLFVSLSAATVSIGVRMVERTQAQTAADAAVLGAVGGGHEAALMLARRHGAELLTFTRGPGARDVTVVVRVGTATAAAAATDEP
jgi:uncharacterized membrane protein AbrB (regulator of aidB expression)